LSYLRRFPIDTLKMDRSFVRDVTTEADDGSIVSAMISMGKRLNRQVVAEGVETPEQVAFLQEQSRPDGHGYYFSPPTAARDFAKLLVRPNPQSFIGEPDRVLSAVNCRLYRKLVVGVRFVHSRIRRRVDQGAHVLDG
jgi:predicted signal transduction protein with EAL and GGDEF domain